ncbi:MAG: DUF4234 domain-containing protein [Frankiaceae bacterium]
MSTQDPSQRPNLGKETPWDAPGAPEQHPGGAGQQPTPPGTGSAPPPGYGTPAAPPPGYGTPTQGYAPAPVGYGIQGKTRGPWAVWLLSIITFGIYFLVWYYKINNEARQYDPRIDVEPGVSVLAIFPGSWIIVPPLISFYNTGKRIGQEQRAAGLPDTCNGWIGLILYVFVFGTGQIYYQYEINKVLDRYPGAEWGQQVPLYF